MVIISKLIPVVIARNGYSSVARKYEFRAELCGISIVRDGCIFVCFVKRTVCECCEQHKEATLEKNVVAVA